MTELEKLTDRAFLSGDAEAERPAGRRVRKLYGSPVGVHCAAGSERKKLLTKFRRCDKLDKLSPEADPKESG